MLTALQDAFRESTGQREGAGAGRFRLAWAPLSDLALQSCYGYLLNSKGGKFARTLMVFRRCPPLGGVCLSVCLSVCQSVCLCFPPFSSWSVLDEWMPLYLVRDIFATESYRLTYLTSPLDGCLVEDAYTVLSLLSLLLDSR